MYSAFPTFPTLKLLIDVRQTAVCAEGRAAGWSAELASCADSSNVKAAVRALCMSCAAGLSWLPASGSFDSSPSSSTAAAMPTDNESTERRVSLLQTVRPLS